MQNFGLGNLEVSTSPCTRLVPPQRSPDPIDSLLTPTLHTMSGTAPEPDGNGPLSNSDIPSIQTSSPQSSGSRTPTLPSTGMASPSPNKRQHPPSPLSKIAPDHANQEDRVPSIPLPSPASESSHRNFQSLVNGIPESSPCFIHSQLDKHASGSLQDWLKNKSQNQNRNPTTSHHPHQHQHHHHHHPQQHHAHRAASHITGAKVPSHEGRSQGSDAQSSVSGTTQMSTSSQSSTVSPTWGGYETDPSSLAGGNEFDEDDEEGRSLTKQLAETAQGVREMSKELGE